MNKRQEIDRLRAQAREIDDGMSFANCAELHQMADALERELQAEWVASLKEQHPAHAAEIDRFAAEADGEMGEDFGNYVLGSLEEQGVQV